MRLVFVVAMVDSIHTARWLSQFADQDLSIILFPSTPHRRVHPEIKALLKASNQMQISIAPMMNVLSLPLWLVDKCLPLRIRSRLLHRLIESEKPVVLHALETQNAGYLVAQTIPHLSFLPKVFLSIWGSDLFWFQQFARHRKKIQYLLSKVDSLGTECQRDVELARFFGFSGNLLPTVPASGGVDLDVIKKLSRPKIPSQRLKIMVKGYSGFVGRSLTALEALQCLSVELAGYEIHVYSASLKTIRQAHRTAKEHQLRIICHKKHSLSRNEVISLLSEARLSISISLSDGFSGSLRESMVTGCFPIESMYSCGNEWTLEGKSALFVDPRDVSSIVKAIKLTLGSDDLVDSAAEINIKLANERFSSAAVLEQVKNYYFDVDQHG